MVSSSVGHVLLRVAEVIVLIVHEIPRVHGILHVIEIIITLQDRSSSVVAFLCLGGSLLFRFFCLDCIRADLLRLCWLIDNFFSFLLTTGRLNQRLSGVRWLLEQCLSGSLLQRFVKPLAFSEYSKSCKRGNIFHIYNYQ